MDNFINISNVDVTNIDDLNIDLQGVSLSVLRLDLIHPIISGNKLFKLKYYLATALAENKNVVTYGGAFSNHLIATAYYCKLLNIRCKGMVRGEKTNPMSETLNKCAAYGMQLEFIARSAYSMIASKFEITNDDMIIPEGGFGSLGVNGGAEIMQHPVIKDASHLSIAVGSATTLAGLIIGNKGDLEVIAVPAIKNMTDIPDRLEKLIGHHNFIPPTIFNEYHFGGFAKINDELISFMNQFYKDHEIPTDRIYTSKLLFTILKKIEDGYFARGSKIVAIHTGGLQGNLSLINNELIF